MAENNNYVHDCKQNRFASSIRAELGRLERTIDISLLLASLEFGWSARATMVKALENAKTINEKRLRLLNLLCYVTDDAVVEFLAELKADNQDHVANVIERKAGRIPMTKEHYESFTGNREKLHNFIDPYDELYDILLDRKVFTDYDVNRVNCQERDTLKSREIVEIIMRKSDCCYEKFLFALNATLQSHVVFILTGIGEPPLPEDTLKRLQDNIRQFTKSLYVTTDLLNELVQQGIFTYRGIERLRCLLSNKSECADLLMKLLMRKSQATFCKICSALENADHEHTAVALFGAVIKGKIDPKGDRQLTNAESVAQQADFVKVLNNDEDLKKLGRSNGFTFEFNNGSITVVFRCYTQSAVDYVMRMYLSKRFDEMLTEKCRILERKYGRTFLTVSVPRVEFDQCRKVLRHNELMTTERCRSIQLSIENHVHLLRVDEELLRRLKLPRPRLDEIRAGNCSEERSKTLLSIMFRQPNRMFQEFIDALKETDQTDLAAQIEQNARTSANREGNTVPLPRENKGHSATVATDLTRTKFEIQNQASVRKSFSYIQVSPGLSSERRPSEAEKKHDRTRAQQNWSSENDLMITRCEVEENSDLDNADRQVEWLLQQKDEQRGINEKTFSKQNSQLELAPHSTRRSASQNQGQLQSLLTGSVSPAQLQRLPLKENAGSTNAEMSKVRIETSGNFDKESARSEEPFDCSKRSSLKRGKIVERRMCPRLRKTGNRLQDERKLPARTDSGYEEPTGSPRQHNNESSPASYTISAVGRPFAAMTLLANQLFVVRDQTECRVEIYRIDDGQLLRTITIAELGNCAAGVVPCEANNCLYIGDANNNVVHRVDLSPDSDNAVVRWKLNGVPVNLLTTSNHNVQVTIQDFGVEEYDTRGKLLRVVRFQN